MLWLCITLPQLPLEALQLTESETACVVTGCEGSTRWLICSNTAAQVAGLPPGMNYTLALALHPQLASLERRPAEERAALGRLAAWGYQFSNTVIRSEITDEIFEARSSALWLEIGASLRLFGGLRNLITQIEHGLRELGYTHSLGIGPTLEGAALLGRAGIRVALTTPQALYARIHPLSISVLQLAPDIGQALYTMGVRSIGKLLEVPRDALARRFGPELVDFIARLTGETPDLRPVFQLPGRYEARCELEHEIRSTEALSFILRRLLHELAGFLRARDTGVERFTIELAHRKLLATVLPIGLSMADRNAERFLILARERLATLELAAPVIGLTVRADQFAEATLQAELFDGTQQQNETLAHTLDRIAARLGPDQIHGVMSAADHRPEASWRHAPLAAVREPLEFPERPLWLLAEPKPLELSALPQIVPSTAERIETGWWDTGDVHRDYYVVRTRGGADLWVFRDLTNHSWYLHGFWS